MEQSQHGCQAGRPSDGSSSLGQKKGPPLTKYNCVASPFLLRKEPRQFNSCSFKKEIQKIALAFVGLCTPLHNCLHF
jgi:hypothetical protein